MTRDQCEDKLLALAEEAQRVFAEYSPDDDYLSLSIVEGHVTILGGTQTLHLYKGENGVIRRTDYWNFFLGMKGGQDGDR